MRIRHSAACGRTISQRTGPESPATDSELVIFAQRLEKVGLAIFAVSAGHFDELRSEPKPSPEIYLAVTSLLRFSRPTAWWWKTP
jgi:hypothetical protein